MRGALLGGTPIHPKPEWVGFVDRVLQDSCFALGLAEEMQLGVGVGVSLYIHTKMHIHSYTFTYIVYILHIFKMYYLNKWFLVVLLCEVVKD